LRPLTWLILPQNYTKAGQLHPSYFYIDSNNESYEVQNPYMNLVAGTAAAAFSKDTAAIEAAAKAFEVWERGDLSDRRDIFLKAAELITEKDRKDPGSYTRGDCF
jgi:acyl-CoA reductase-like NAD-dependent aldehyde dehydrogenase